MAKHAKTSHKKWLILPLLISLIGFVPGMASATPSLHTLDLLSGNTDSNPATLNPEIGGEDPYTETSTDGGTTWHPAYLVGGNHPWGNVAGTNSWVNCEPSFFSCANATSLYRYRFWVPDDFASPTISGAMIMDNYGSVFLNGNILVNDEPGSYSIAANTDVTGKLIAGWNELRVQLRDVGGWAGINFNLQIGIQSELPMRLASRGNLVIYDGQGGTPSRDNDSVLNGASISSFPSATKAGFDLVGWFTAPSPGGTRKYEPFTPTGDTTLYAQWVTHVDHVYYDEQGGNSVADGTYDSGVAFILPSDPGRVSYNFAGWWDSSSGGTKLGNAGDSYTRTGSGDITIYAHWTSAVVNYSVFYDEQGGSAVADDTYADGDTLTLPAAPIRNGYTFRGWFDAIRRGTKLGNAGDSHTFNGSSDVTVFAQWTKNSTYSPSPTPVEPTPAPVGPRRKLITTFKGDKAQLLKPMFGQIKKFITGLPANAVITCQGSTRNTKITMFDKWLARKRATNVCLQAQKLRKDITFNITLNPASANRVSARHVWMIFR